MTPVFSLLIPLHRFVRNRFLIISYASSLRWVKYQAIFFSFPCILSLVLPGIKKIFKNFLTSLSWFNYREISYICIPLGAQTHMMTHTNIDRRARPRNPFLCRKKTFYKQWKSSQSLIIINIPTFKKWTIIIFNQVILITVIKSFLYTIML